MSEYVRPMVLATVDLKELGAHPTSKITLDEVMEILLHYQVFVNNGWFKK